jgi:hypothetical protein
VIVLLDENFPLGLRNCVRELLQASKPERLYELMDNGALLPWRDSSSDT